MKAPIIMLIILLFVAIFLYGSVLEPYIGEGIYYGRVQLADGVQWLDTVIRFEPVEGGQQFFTLYYILNENAADDAPIVSMTTSKVQYSGSYFKHIFGPLFLRPTGLHFPVIDFEGQGKFVMNSSFWNCPFYFIRLLPSHSCALRLFSSRQALHPAQPV